MAFIQNIENTSETFFFSQSTAHCQCDGFCIRYALTREHLEIKEKFL